MKKNLKTITSHPLISGSAIVFIGSFLINGCNYLFNLLMGRVLSVSEYGVLISIISLISFFSIFQAVLANLFTKFSAEFSARKHLDLQAAFIGYGFRMSALIAFVFFLVLLLFFIPISSFLNISVSDPGFLLLAFLTISVVILLSFPLGVFQGELKFIKVTLLNVSGVITKILVGLVLVLGGLGVYGGLIAVLLSFLLPYILGISNLFKKITEKKEEMMARVNFISEFKKVSLPFLLATLSITVIQNTDVIFARHYLSPVDAGRFAALSLMGKAIFYVTSPIYLVFFPLIIHKKEKKEKTLGTLLLAGFIILSCNLFFSSMYFIFPAFIIRLFFPAPEYQVLISNLGLYSLFVSFFSVAFLLHNYFLSISKSGIYKINLLAAIFFITLLVFYHDSIQHIVYALLSSSLLLLTFLFVYYFRNERN